MTSRLVARIARTVFALFASLGFACSALAQTSALENPPRSGSVSGIGLVSGWTCGSGSVEISFDGAPRIGIPSGGSRGDTQSICGRSNTGFGLLFNFNLLGSGSHSAQLYVGGAPVGTSVPFTVVAHSGEFLSGAAKSVIVSDFPSAGRTVTLQWQEAAQNFAIVGATGGTPPTASAEGAWTGTTANGLVTHMLILEDNSFYLVYGVPRGSVLTVYGFMAGQATQTATTLSGSFADYDQSGTALNGTFSATHVPNVSLQGHAVAQNQSLGFALTPMATTMFNYQQPANLATIAGGWTGVLLDGDAATVTVSIQGSVSGTSGGCLFSGTVSPRASGRNVFNVSLTFGGPPCQSPGQAMSGIGIVETSTPGAHELLVVVQNPSKSLGALFMGSR